MLNQFHEIKPMERALAEAAFNSNDPEKICDALIRITYHDRDYQWGQNKCIAFLKSDDLEIKRLAIICLGHLASIHNKLDKTLVVPLLTKLRDDKDVGALLRMPLVISICF